MLAAIEIWTEVLDTHIGGKIFESSATIDLKTEQTNAGNSAERSKRSKRVGSAVIGIVSSTLPHNADAEPLISNPTSPFRSAFGLGCQIWRFFRERQAQGFEDTRKTHEGALKIEATLFWYLG